VETRKKAALESKETVQKRLQEMGIQPDEVNTYRFGDDHLYCPIWKDLTKTGKDATTALMTASANASRDLGPTNAGEQKSLPPQCICASKMHCSHVLIDAPSFFSIQMQYAVCGTALKIEKRN